MKKKPKLNQFERDRIEAMFSAGCEQKEIAKVLDRDKGTISREISRNRRKIRKKGGTTDGKYESSVAQQKAYNRRKYAKYQGKKINEDKALRKYIVSGLKQCWNPDEISGRMKADSLPFYASKTAIYEWLYSMWGQRYCKLLPSKQYQKKRRKKNKTKRQMIPNRVSINERPEGFGAEFGHLEHDTFVSGKKTGSKSAGSVVLEPLAGFVALRKISNLKPLTNESAIQDMLNEFLNAKSITRDNGQENRKHELTSIPSYYCDPYSAWQKPRVEQIIKTLRRFFKKGCDLDNYSDEEMRFAAFILNSKPRKRLSYKTPFEVMVKYGMLNIEYMQKQKNNRFTNDFKHLNRESVAIGG
jgi:IS30 family transposase